MNEPGSALLQTLAHRIVVFDGAMGTSVHALDLSLDAYDGLENCVEILNLTRPEAIEQIHRSFLEVGCDVVETNTFGGSKLTLAEFGLADRTHEINRAAAQIARRAAEAISTPQRPRWVAGSIGPGTKLISLRQVDYATMLDSFYEQARGLLDGGVDLVIVETCQDILQAKTAIQAVRQAFEGAGRRVPLICQVTVETTGTMLLGTDIAAALVALEAYPEVDVVGLNCATGPQEMSEHIRYLSRACTRFLSVMPNAGLPQVVNGQAHFPLTPGELARWLKEFVEVDGVNVVGGCCGTTPAHLAAVVAAVGGLKPRQREPRSEPACSSLYQPAPFRQDNSFLIVGERCNTNGSRQFKRLLAEGDIDGLVQMAVDQVAEGSHVLDVCVDYVGRDGVADMLRVVDRFAKEVTVPLMLDSTEAPVIEAGLQLAGGKCIVNSVNLEDGEQKLRQICPLLRQYGAAVVALTIDEDPLEAMAKTADRKLEIALRLHDLLTRKYGIRAEDVFFDLLTFPITTGAEADRRMALETLEGIERVSAELPRCQFILGVSNVSFGLAPAARAVLNSAFLHEARQRGLTAAIVHASKILPRNQISDERWQAAMDLIYDRRASADPLERFIGLFSEGEQVGATKTVLADLPIEERLTRRIIDGQRQGLADDLDAAMKQYAPLEIINTFLLDGMKVVGDLFGSGQMQLPFVLKSAETMKAAVAQLEPHMERVAGQTRGKIVLATVRGDVHDIGKNLVDIILTNNGYTVYNLGIKQPIANVIEAFKQHNADAIGLSGLLVKSTLVMRDDLIVLNEHRLSPPVILGGAALTRRYVEDDLRPTYGGRLFYAKDAFDGLRLMRELTEDGGTQGRRDEEQEATDGERGPLAREGDERHEGTKARRHEGASGPPARAVAETPELEPATIDRRGLERLEVEIEQRYGLAEIDEDDDAPAKRRSEKAARVDSEALDAGAATGTATLQRSDIPHEHAVPTPPFWGARVLEKIALKAALGYMNETMLFQVQWGFRKKGRSPEAWKRFVNAEIRPIYRELVARCEAEAILQPQAIYGFWPANSDGDDLVIYEPPGAGGGHLTDTSGERQREGDDRHEGTKARRHEGECAPLARPAGQRGLVARADGERGPLARPSESHGATQPRSDAGPGSRKAAAESNAANGALDPATLTPLLRFRFPRQRKAPYRSLSDFWRPASSGRADVAAFHIVTAGRRVSEVARQWFAENQYQQYLFLHGLGVETAEALAEYIHKQVRMDLGVAERDARELQKLFKQGYQGSRFSFGYPACPNLEDQRAIMQLLRPERIGVTLSEEYQLDPEQSTSAIITAHPAARYFNVR